VTNPELIHRAEQACLGALLARHGHSGTGAAVVGDTGQSAVLQPQDFTDPVHQAIFAALTSQPATTRPDGPAGWIGRLRDLLERLLSGQAHRAAAYMAELPGLCPDPANLPAYAAMVTEASGQRAAQARAQLAEQAAREDRTLASAGAWLDATGTTARPPGRRISPEQAAAVTAPAAAPAAQDHAVPAPAFRPGQPTVDLAPDTARLARALRADARRATRPDQGTDRDPGRAARRMSDADPVARSGDQPARVRPEDLEDRILASLMRHPADGQAVTGWLPADAFSTAPHRDLYDLIRQRLASGRPVDPLIIAWDASRLPDIPSSHEYGGAAFLTQVALQVGALDPAPGTAEILGRALWANRIMVSTLGENWTSDPEGIRMLTVTGPDDPGQGPDPAPATTAQAAPGPAPDGPSWSAWVKPAVIAAAAQQLVSPASPRPVPLLQPPAPVPDGPALRM
jgi:hypothetical protein